MTIWAALHNDTQPGPWVCAGWSHFSNVEEFIHWITKYHGIDGPFIEYAWIATDFIHEGWHTISTPSSVDFDNIMDRYKNVIFLVICQSGAEYSFITRDIQSSTKCVIM